MAGTNTTMVDIDELRTTVTRLAESVSRLTVEVSGLMATHDGGVYGDDYAADGGPAMRARLFESTSDHHTSRMDEIKEQVTQLEATMAEITSIQAHFNEWGRPDNDQCH